MLADCSALALVSVRTPSIVASSSSRMSVIVDSTTRGFAPGSVTLTEMIGESVSGYSRTDRRWKAMAPNRTSAALIMLARTGRRIDMSESFTLSHRWFRPGAIPWSPISRFEIQRWARSRNSTG